MRWGPIDPWYKVAALRKEVREGRSFSPDELSTAMEQAVEGTGPAPADYCDPGQYLSGKRAIRER